MDAPTVVQITMSDHNVQAHGVHLGEQLRRRSDAALRAVDYHCRIRVNSHSRVCLADIEKMDR
ncbi:MAG: hypothetical protein OXE75_08495 [bacterium]|nr:hypothetical protein [bacterium]